MLVHAQVQKSLVTSEVKSALDLPCFPITFPHFLIFDYFPRAPENSNVFNSPKRFELWYPANTAVSPSSSPPGTFRPEELSDRNSILMK